MSEEAIIGEVTYINGQKVYNENFIEPLVLPMPKSPIESSMEQAAFLSKEIASAKLSNKNLAEQNAFITKELAISQAKNKQLAEQQASILMLLAEQINPPVEEVPDTSPDESNSEQPNEEEIPKDGE